MPNILEDNVLILWKASNTEFSKGNNLLAFFFNVWPNTEMAEQSFKAIVIIIMQTYLVTTSAMSQPFAITNEMNFRLISILHQAWHGKLIYFTGIYAKFVAEMKLQDIPLWIRWSHFMTYNDKQHGFVTENHHLSWNVTKYQHMSWNPMLNGCKFHGNISI